MEYVPNQKKKRINPEVNEKEMADISESTEPDESFDYDQGFNINEVYDQE